jgi:flavin-dependent dehydrogenase
MKIACARLKQGFQLRSFETLSLSTTDVSPKRFPVAIIGGGPVGVLLSRLLSDYGIENAIVDRRTEPTNHPQAHYLNTRSMEIMYAHFHSAWKEICGTIPTSDHWR